MHIFIPFTTKTAHLIIRGAHPLYQRSGPSPDELLLRWISRIWKYVGQKTTLSKIWVLEWLFHGICTTLQGHLSLPAVKWRQGYVIKDLSSRICHEGLGTEHYHCQPLLSWSSSQDTAMVIGNGYYIIWGFPTGHAWALSSGSFITKFTEIFFPKCFSMLQFTLSARGTKTFQTLSSFTTLGREIPHTNGGSATVNPQKQRSPQSSIGSTLMDDGGMAPTALVMAAVLSDQRSVSRHACLSSAVISTENLITSCFRFQYSLSNMLCMIKW